jgi:hypothetical protein
MPAGNIDLDQSGRALAPGFLVQASAQGYCAPAIAAMP